MGIIQQDKLAKHSSQIRVVSRTTAISFFRLKKLSQPVFKWAANFKGVGGCGCCLREVEPNNF